MASSLVRAASWMAPDACRDEFRSEWLGEIHDALDLIARRRAAQRTAAQLELVRRTAGAFVHAVWLRKEQWSLDMLWQDLRFAARLLVGRPAFTAVAMLLVALGVGANTAIFGLVYGVLLRPLPFHEPDRLVQLWETNPLRNWTNATASPANLLDWRSRNRVFEQIAFYPAREDGPMFTQVTVTGVGREPEPLNALRVSVNLFRTLGVVPLHGRDFDEAEQVQGAHQVTILSHGFWQARFAGDPHAIGRDITINTQPHRIIGVMPPHVRFPSVQAQLWVPFAIDEGFARTRRAHYLRPIARLNPGVTLPQAREDVQRIASELEREYPDTNTQMGADLGPLQEWTVRDVRRALLVLLGTVGMVLLVASANVANLLLARASGRTREFAIRAALGGARWRLMRQLLAESLLLALAGGLLGLFVARWTLAAIVAFTPSDVPRIDEVALDGQMLLFVLALTLVTALLFGLAPAWYAGHADARWLRESAPSSPARAWARRVLVVAQIATSVTLLIAAGLFLRSFDRLRAVPPGFDPVNAVSFDVRLPSARYDTDARATAFFEELIRRFRLVPGVQAAGGATVIGLEGQGWTGDLFIEKQPDVWGRELRHKEVTQGYFEAMGLPVLSGRGFTALDTQDAPPVVIVNETLARTYFPGTNPIGQRIAFARPAPERPSLWHTLVGVVADERQNALNEPVAPGVYQTHLQNSTPGMTIVVRGELPPSSLVPVLRAELRALEPAVAMINVRTLEEVVAQSVARERFTTWAIGLFAVLALTIAAVGLYGVLAYLVGLRMREIGIRVALGAGRRHVMALVFRETALLLAAGLAIGMLAAAISARAIRTLLYGTAPTDPLTYAAVVTLLCAVSVMAAYLPARRTMRVDPIVTLRVE